VQLAPGDDPQEVFDRLHRRLLAYDIFPPRLVHAAIWPAGPIRAGVTIVQRVVVGPLGLESAVRVMDSWDRTLEAGREAGFAYATLPGHPERGVASVAGRLDALGQVRVHLEVRSEAGLLLTRLGRPVARLFQRSLTRAALRRLTTRS
jgi:uncharacterized protein (UPF0548 family)